MSIYKNRMGAWQNAANSNGPGWMSAAKASLDVKRGVNWDLS